MYDRKMLLKAINMLDRVIIRKSGIKRSRIVQADKKTGKTINTFYTAILAGKNTGIPHTAIAQCISSPKRKTSHDFIWRKEYIDD